MKDYSNLEKIINYSFKDKKLLENVFVHRSYLNEHKNFYLPSNERLEFLGDSVLSLITSVYLFKHYPFLKEGEYTEIKSAIVKTESLAEAAKDINLDRYLFLSKGEEKMNGRKNKNILADCFEAFIGSIFLDSNFENAYQFVVKFLFKEKLDKIVRNKEYQPFKSRLQELIQAKYKKLPEYKILEEKGPEHKRVFKVGVYFNDKIIGEGVGMSKKEAEEKAAKKAFVNFKSL
ncbi:MAG: ribonuclease 3 [Patescibacteria group bacterium]|nr:MAG: ribonuclease 3 [Patescibacteria group bacterium]